jgi:hypothetical protein
MIDTAAATYESWSWISASQYYLQLQLPSEATFGGMGVFLTEQESTELLRSWSCWYLSDPVAEAEFENARLGISHLQPEFQHRGWDSYDNFPSYKMLGS